VPLLLQGVNFCCGGMRDLNQLSKRIHSSVALDVRYGVSESELDRTTSFYATNGVIDTVLTIDSGKAYRFRMVNAGAR